MEERPTSKKNRSAAFPRRKGLIQTIVLFGTLFLLAAALVAVLWVFTDLPVAVVFTCLGVLFAAAEGVVLARALLSAMRLAAVRGSADYDKALVRRDGCALFFDADAERFLAYADAALRAERARGKNKKPARAEAKRLRARVGKPLCICGFTAFDAASLQGKTLYVSGAYYAESGGTLPQKVTERAEERAAAWKAAAQKNLLAVMGEAPADAEQTENNAQANDPNNDQNQGAEL